MVTSPETPQSHPRRRLLAGALAFGAWPLALQAQFRVEISGVGGNQLPIGVTRFRDEDKSGQSISGIIRADLERSGVFRIVDFPPETTAMRALDPATMHASLGDGAPRRGRPPRHPAMHRTRTIDYAVVMSGEIDMLLDDSEIHLVAGDVLVQQGTNHAWVNRGTEPCRIAFVLIDAEEP